jgi:hypothetical protein
VGPGLLVDHGQNAWVKGVEPLAGVQVQAERRQDQGLELLQVGLKDGLHG